MKNKGKTNTNRAAEHRWRLLCCSVLPTPPPVEPALCTMEHKKALKLCFYFPKTLWRLSHGIFARDLEGSQRKREDKEIWDRCSTVALQHQDQEEHQSPSCYSQNLHMIFSYSTVYFLSESSSN